MKKRSMEYLLKKSTRKMRILGASMFAIFVVVFAGYYISVVSPSRAVAFSGVGAGTESDPYLISNCSQLQEVQDVVSRNSFAKFALISDIDCTDTVNWNSGAGFAPITSFRGIFDGRNYEIKDLYINRPTQYYAGLFDSLLNGPAIRNVNFTKSEANKDRTDINGAREAGSVAGFTRNATIANVHSSLTIQGNGKEAGGDNSYMNVGGLVGDMDGGLLENSSFTGKVTFAQTDEARGGELGGLVGHFELGGSSSPLDGKILNSYSSGEIFAGETSQGVDAWCGGLVGSASVLSRDRNLTIEHSYASGSVTCNKPDATRASGAFVGTIGVGASNINLLPNFTNNFATGRVVSSVPSGGFYGNVAEPGSYDVPPGNDGNQFSANNNKFDATGTGKTTCGAQEEVNPRWSCTAVNQAGDQPDYFKSTADNDSFFNEWNQSTLWTIDGDYPQFKDQTVRPDPVVSLSVSRSDNNFVVSWSASPVIKGRNTNITGYEIMYSFANIDNGRTYKVYEEQAAPDANSITLTGIPIPGRYFFKVRAVTAGTADDQQGIFTSPLEFATGMPSSAPQDVTIDAKAKIASLKWREVTDATGYDVQYRKTGSETWLSPLLADSASAPEAGFVKKSMYGLDPQTGYEFRVVAKNVAGLGPWSDTIAVTTVLPSDFTVSTCQELQDIEKDPEANYVLTKDIDCNGFDNFHSIPAFIGSLDGKGFKITNLSIYKDINISSSDINAIGLFAVTLGAKVKNVTIQDSAIVATYNLAENVDKDQNGLPDAPVVDPIDTGLSGSDIPTSAQDIANQASTTVVPQVLDQGQQIATEVPTIAQQFAKVSSGGLVGVAVAGGSFSNIRVLNTTVAGGLAGGVIGALLPISGLANIPSVGELAEAYPPLTIDNLQSSGLVAGNMAGGLIGAAASSLSSLMGAPGTLTILNSSSSSEVQANVGGGLLGAGISLTVGQGALTGSEISSKGDSLFGNLDFLNSIFKATSSQDVVIKNSFATGSVSSCEATSALRIGVLGGLVGIGVGTSIESSYATGKVKTCSGTPSNWGVYGGAMGGLGGFMVTSRVTDSYALGNVEAIENSNIDQYAPGIFVGATGGLVGFNATFADDSDGRYAINNSYSKGDTIITGKQGLVAASGGLAGIQLGTGTVKSSYTTGRIVHVSPQQNLFSLSVAGGLNGLTLGVDSTFILKSAWSYPKLSTPTHGFDFIDSYTTGDVVVDKSDRGGNLAVTGGITGFFLGQGTISGSHTTGNITNNLPDDVRIRLRDNRNSDVGDTGYSGGSGIEDQLFGLSAKAVLGLSQSKYGATISGGLVGSGLGVDAPAFATLTASGISSQGQDDRVVFTQGIVVDNSYQTGNVEGNLAGGIFGSADLKIKINKTYSDGNIQGSIVGGLIGQNGFVTTLGHGSFGFFIAQIVNNAQKNNSMDEIPNIIKLFDKGREAAGTLDLTNTYSTGKLTGTPGLSVVEVGDSGGIDPGSDKPTILGQEVKEFPAPGALPTTVGGLVGISMSPGSKIANSYASGDIEVKADPAYNPDPNWKIKLPKIPSFAGGIVGIDLALPQINFAKTVAETTVSENGEGIQSPENYQADIPKMENVFSAAKISLSSSTITGGAVGLFMSPIPFIGTFVLGYPSGSITVDEVATFKNVYIDEARISVEGCGGPQQLWSDVAKNLTGQLVVPDQDGKDKFPHEDVDKGISSLASTVNPLLVKPACEYVNKSNSSPRYFIQNNINTPMDKWDFKNVWVIRKNDYPKFVAGAETVVEPPAPQPPTVTKTTATPVSSPVTKAFESLLKPTDRNSLRKSDYNWLQLLLRRIPPLLAKSIPYLLILMILILAARYAKQALKQYRELKTYHRNVLRILSTKESIDDYLAITTHYLNTPSAIMGGAVELLVSLKKIPATLGASISAKIKTFADAASKLEVANQVSGAESANTVKPIQRKQNNPFWERAVWMPSVIALSLLLVANALFMYAGVYNNSIARIAIEISLMLISIGLLALSYRYRETMEQNKLLAKQQLEEESKFYDKRQSFIAHAAIVTHDNHLMLEAAGNDLKKIPESKLFFNGLAMLGGITSSLNNLKSFSKVSDNPPLYDVTSGARKAVKDVEEQAKAKNVTIVSNITDGMVTRIEANEMKQLVGSLLDNAVKFSKDDGRVELSVTRTYSKVLVKVVDNGIGISKEKLPSLLKPFTRGTDSMEYNYEGVGLSLYTNKILLNKLGGKIAIESHLNKGTVVTVEIPAGHDPKAIVPMLIGAK